MNVTREDQQPQAAGNDGPAQPGQAPLPAVSTEPVAFGVGGSSSVAAAENQSSPTAAPAPDQSLGAAEAAAESTPDAAGWQRHTVRLERISNLIFEEVVLVRHLGVDSLAVVLKPDARTELFLRLFRQNGHIEAQVRVDRGDFTALNAQWPRLAESLAQHGVHVQPLLPATDLAGGPPSSALAHDPKTASEPGPQTADHGQGRNSSHRRPPQREWDTDFAAVGSPTEPVGRRTARVRQAARRVFEDWA